jgi:hypothetical protein
MIKNYIFNNIEKFKNILKTVTIIEAVLMVTLFIIPIPGTLEAYLIGKAAYVKFISRIA